MNNVGKALVKKKVLKLGSKDIDTIENSDVYGTYKDLYMSKKGRWHGTNNYNLGKCNL